MYDVISLWQYLCDLFCLSMPLRETERDVRRLLLSGAMVTYFYVRHSLPCSRDLSMFVVLSFRCNYDAMRPGVAASVC